MKLLVIIQLFVFSLSFGQFQNVLISSVSSPNEPSIFINPKNTNQMIASANIASIYKSNDAGYTWTRQSMTSNFGVWGDPCIVADTSGKFYYFHLSNTGGANGWIDRIVCQRLDSLNGSWSAGVGIGLNGIKDQDKEWVTINHLTNELYLSWTQFDAYSSTAVNDSSNILFSKSSDGGNTWTNPIRINQYGGDCLDEDNTTEGAVPAVGINGELYVAWANHQLIYFDKSLDDGVSWLATDKVVTTQPGGWDFLVNGTGRSNGMPILLCDHSGGNYNGNIYINWADKRNGSTNSDIFIIKSQDGGNTWSNPLKVNNDTTTREQFFTWMCIDQSSGYLYCVFYDRRNYGPTSDSTDVYIAISKDGGNSFENVKISNTAFVPTSSSFFGDYTNISAQHGVIRPIWTRMDNGLTSVYTAIIDTIILNMKLRNEPIFEFDDCASVYYDNAPFIAYKLRRNSKVSILLYSMMGNNTAIIRNNDWMSYGKYVEKIDKSAYNLNSGVYICVLKTDDKIQVKKIVIQ